MCPGKKRLVKTAVTNLAYISKFQAILMMHIIKIYLINTSVQIIMLDNTFGIYNRETIIMMHGHCQIR
jgi:hypothetical protein